MTEMEAVLRRNLEEIRTLCDGTVQGLAYRLESCREEEPELTVSLRPEPWMQNVGGIMHGGVIAILCDNAMGMMSRWCAPGRLLHPTVDMQLRYFRPVPMDRRVFVRSRCRKSGRTLMYLEAAVWAEGAEDAVCAEAAATFFCTPLPAGGEK